MRGSLRQRSKGSWRITLEFGYQPHPDTGRPKHVQKFVTFHGTKRQAQEKLTDLLGAANRSEFVEPSKITLDVWLMEWLDASVKPRCRAATYVRYKGIIEQNILKAAIATVPLQQLRPTHLEYASARVSASALSLHHAPSSGVPQGREGSAGRGERHWESRREATKRAGLCGPPAARLDGGRGADLPRGGNGRWSPAGGVLDSSARKGELCGLR